MTELQLWIHGSLQVDIIQFLQTYFTQSLQSICCQLDYQVRSSIIQYMNVIVCTIGLDIYFLYACSSKRLFSIFCWGLKPYFGRPAVPSLKRTWQPLADTEQKWGGRGQDICVSSSRRMSSCTTNILNNG